jgi:hypothetical protein
VDVIALENVTTFHFSCILRRLRREEDFELDPTENEDRDTNNCIRRLPFNREMFIADKAYVSVAFTQLMIDKEQQIHFSPIPRSEVILDNT